MSVLRFYDDPAECDGQGVPLDFERCRKCGGSGRYRDVRIWGTMPGSVPCDTCGGYGSLRRAALEMKALRLSGLIRCECCFHPLSDGVWEGQLSPNWTYEQELSEALRSLKRGVEPFRGAPFGQMPVYYSDCDDRCKHRGPLRWLCAPPESIQGWVNGDVGRDVGQMIVGGDPLRYSASWRWVDVHLRGHPCDLRPEKIAVLCLRCRVL